MSGPMEGFIWLLLCFGFLGVAVLGSIISAVLAFVGRHKFWIILCAIVGWVGYKLVKNSEKGNNIIDVKPIKDVREKTKDVTKYLN